MGHFVTSEDSDYFVGYCECEQRPCLSCIAAQKKIEHYEKCRGELCQLYYEHHQHWPSSFFMDELMKALDRMQKERVA